jgi:hypothetical protein
MGPVDRDRKIARLDAQRDLWGQRRLFVGLQPVQRCRGARASLRGRHDAAVSSAADIKMADNRLLENGRQDSL